MVCLQTTKINEDGFPTERIDYEIPNNKGEKKMQEKIEIEKNGKKYIAFYKVEKGYVTVYGGFESKTSHIKGMDPQGIECMAKLLMSELINEGKITEKDK